MQTEDDLEGHGDTVSKLKKQEFAIALEVWLILPGDSIWRVLFKNPLLPLWNVIVLQSS